MKQSQSLNQVYRISKIGSWMFLISLVGVIIQGLVNFIFSLILGLVSQEGLRQASLQMFDLSAFKPLIIVFLVTMPLSLLGQSLNLYGGLNSGKKLKEVIMMKALHQSDAMVKSAHSGDVMTLLTSDASIVEDYYFQSLNYMLLHPLVGGIAALVTTLLIDYRFVLISIVAGMITIAISYHYTDKIQQGHKHTREKDQTSITQASEILSNETMLRQFQREDYYLSVYDEKNEAFQSSKVAVDNIGNKIKMWQAIVNIASMMAFLSFGFYLSQTTGFEFSKIMLLLPMKSLMSYMFNSLGTSWGYLLSVGTAADRIVTFLDSDSEDMRLEYPSFVKRLESPIVSFENVSFGYDETPLLKDFNIEIQEGQSVGFVGSSGSGKSTSFKLLMGLYQNYCGTIKLNGVDVKECSLNSIRDQMVAVEQESPLFNQSLFHNIALGSTHPERVTLNDVISVCKTAAIHDFIMTLKDGYDTLVGEAGGNISGGQRQRIAIARALMSDAPILILDEPTASLDSESEQLIQETIDRIKKEKTVLISAHRLSTVKDLDIIFVLNDGMIKEQGTHHELIRMNGLYANLLAQQRGN